jgi:hypothetical protein
MNDFPDLFLFGRGYGITLTTSCKCTDLSGKLSLKLGEWLLSETDIFIFRPPFFFSKKNNRFIEPVGLPGRNTVRLVLVLI